MRKFTTEDFIKKAKEVHDNKYNYSKVEYINSITKVCIICPIHGEFWQKPNNHLFGKGCAKCSGNAKLTTESFIEKTKEVHGDRYDYSKVEYINNSTPVCIICLEHGEFWQIPHCHISGGGCPTCGLLSIVVKNSSNTESFINKAKEAHGDKYDYSKVDYISAHTKIIITCHEKDENGNEHGEFLQTPNSHLNGSGCPKCGKIKNTQSRTKTLEQFIEEAKNIHRDKYDYSKSEYMTNNTNICIICPIHGEFLQTPSAHLSGQGCPKCGIVKRAVSQTKTTEQFIEEAKKVHGDKYDYSKVDYINGHTHVCIICPEHGEFWQTPNHHINHQGCPVCNESILEKKLKMLFNNNNIAYEHQKKFDWLGRLSLDFYLPDYNIAIECQGRQHFEPVTAFGGDEEFQKVLERDVRKSSLCEKNNVKLILYSEERFKKYNPSLYYNEEGLLKAIKEKDI